ncbi:MAG: hypothetical protein JNG84_09990 [Archangium sp.]|nr:hypothetical protein [Archangium sp.]
MVAIRTKPIATPPAPTKRTLLKVTVTENDPTLSAKSTTGGFQVSGRASNNGIVASTLKLEFSGQTVTLRLSAGDTSETVLAKLKKAVPKGFEVIELARAKRLPPDITIGISPLKATPAPLQPSKIPTGITGPNAGASVQGSLFVNRMPGPGPRPTKAIASITVSGTGFDDSPPKYSVKEVRVYEQGTNTLVMTLKSPKVESDTSRRGMKEQAYRLEVPLAKLDPKKKYTFALNTGINGAAAQWVRSEYLPLTSAF